jgi:hypothetical protein
MKYRLHLFLLLVGIVSLVGVGLVWNPATFAYLIFFSVSRENTVVDAITSGVFVIGAAAFLLWVAREAWREIVRIRAMRSKEVNRECLLDPFPSWGKPPPLPGYSPTATHQPQN